MLAGTPLAKDAIPYEALGTSSALASKSNQLLAVTGFGSRECLRSR